MKLPLFLIAAALSAAQGIVSTHAGLITEVHGAVYLDDQQLTPRNKLSGETQVQMKDHQVLRIEKGQAVLSVSPDADMSLDPHSELRIDDTRLEQTQVTLLRGAATLRRGKAIQVPGGQPVRVQLGQAVVEIGGTGIMGRNGIHSLFRFEAETQRLEVIYGRATVESGRKRLTVGDGKKVDLNALAVSDMDDRAVIALSRGWESPVANFNCLAGEFYIDNERFVMQEFAGHLSLVDGQLFRIEQGWAELEMLGVTFRVAQGTAFHLEGREIVFERGALVGSLPVLYPSKSPVFRLGDHSIRFSGQAALFQFENPPGVVRVYRGDAEMESQGATMKIGSGKNVDLSAAGFKVQKLDRGKTPPLSDAPNGYFPMDARPLVYASGPVGAGGVPSPILPQREHCKGPPGLDR